MTKEQIDDLFKVLDWHKEKLLTAAKEIDELFDETLDVLYSHDGDVVSYFVLKGLDFLGELDKMSHSRNGLFSRLLLMKPPKKKLSA